MTRLWTGKGDDGTTGLLFGGRAGKDSPRIAAVGAVDEAQAAIGVAASARAEAEAGSELDDLLVGLERDLWVLMAELATIDENAAKLVEGQTQVTPAMVERLEAILTDVGGRFELPAEFVVPGQDRTSALLDLARTIVRRAERAAVDVPGRESQVVPYLNRLSSVLWTLARWVEVEPLRSRSR